tara:strand:+ start:116 stop:787 length:672 start_codon:yes stop_codon:yes gene_type:complete
MWAKIESGNIVTIYNNPVRLKDAEGTVYPASYFTDNTKLAKFYVYPVVFKNSIPLKINLYEGGAESFAWNNSTKVVDGTYDYTTRSITDVPQVWKQSEIDDGQAPSGTSAGDPKNDEDGNQIIKIGLKVELTAVVKDMQTRLLNQTDKWVTRKSEKGTAIPETVTTWRDGIRTAHTTMIASITGAANFDAISVLFDATYNDKNVMTAPAPLYNFPVAPSDMPQ